MSSGPFASRQAQSRAYLLEVTNDLSQQPFIPNLPIRIATNLGGCAMHFEDSRQQKAEFSLALTLQPDDPALVNAAQIALLNNEPRRSAVLHAPQRDPSILMYRTISPGLIRSQPENSHILAMSHNYASVPCCEALGQIRYHEGRYQEAEDFLRIASRTN